MWLYFLIVILASTLALFFITTKKHKTKIESLEQNILDKKQKMKQSQTKREHHDEILDKLKGKNKKLKITSQDNKKLIKENQQLRNQLSEMEEKNDLIQENKRKLQEEREQLKKKIEKQEEKLSHLQKENDRLKNIFLQNNKIRSYQTIIEEALILKTFLNDSTRRLTQIIHDFPDLSEKNLNEYLEHLCNLNLIEKIDDETYRRSFTLEKKEHIVEEIISKIFDCDLQRFKKILK